jgi:hypothetical protein
VRDGRIVGNPQISGIFPLNLSIEQISVATGRQLSVLCQRHLGDTSSVSGPMANPLTLIADATGRNLILNGGICNLGCTNEFNGWPYAGRLVPLRPRCNSTRRSETCRLPRSARADSSEFGTGNR